MILSKEDYRFYREADRVTLHIGSYWPTYFLHNVWRFERALRRVEYWKNCHQSRILLPIYILHLLHYYRLSLRLGFTIPPNVFGPGLSIAHPGTLIVNGGVQIGENCRIHPGVTIGVVGGEDDRTPKIGRNAFIGPNAVIVGPIEIGDDCAIGANSFVNRSFSESGITIAGAPARKVSEKGSFGLHRRSTDLVQARRGEKR